MKTWPETRRPFVSDTARNSLSNSLQALEQPKKLWGEAGTTWGRRQVVEEAQVKFTRGGGEADRDRQTERWKGDPRKLVLLCNDSVAFEDVKKNQVMFPKCFWTWYLVVPDFKQLLAEISGWY